MRTWRTVRPPTSTRATPGARSRRLRTTWSASSDSSRELRSGPSSERTTVACALSPSKRDTNGCLASRGKFGCTEAILSRTSCTARFMSASTRNSTTVSLRPSQLFERIILMPAMPFRASSIGRVSSLSVASGDAPG